MQPAGENEGRLRVRGRPHFDAGDDAVDRPRDAWGHLGAGLPERVLLPGDGHVGNVVRDDDGLPDRVLRVHSGLFRSGHNLGLSVFGAEIQQPPGAVFSLGNLHPAYVTQPRGHDLHADGRPKHHHRRSVLGVTAVHHVYQHLFQRARRHESGRCGRRHPKPEYDRYACGHSDLLQCRKWRTGAAG
uniref:(northern house mosquito) hypothetical protein n=1 Tax=Culex pipiens TaxID=7175 RepID=A0A8D8BYU8_CULPI